MTDFNNNINKFRPIEKPVDVKITKTSGEQKSEEKELVQEQAPKFVQDTGVLGRSQIKQPKEVGIAKSVDEAVSLAMNKTPILTASEKIFEDAYERYIAEGKSDADAYILAALEEDEFLSIVE